MAKLNDVQTKVLEVLTSNPQAREDDYILIIEVLKTYWPTNGYNIWADINYIFTHHKELGLPSLEGITRARRKVQRAHPELCDKATQELRRKEEEAYIEYARQ